MKVKGESYYRLRRNNSVRYALFSLVLIMMMYMLYMVYYSIVEQPYTAGYVSDIRDEYIILTDEEGFDSYIPKKSVTMPVLKGMNAISYGYKGAGRLNLWPFYISVLLVMSSVFFVVRFFRMHALLKKDRAMRENLFTYGTKYKGEYVSTEKLKGMRHYRLKVAHTDPFTGSKTYYYSTDLMFNPKNFIPGLENITIFADLSDPEIYFVDFGGDLPGNEYFYGYLM